MGWFYVTIKFYFLSWMPCFLCFWLLILLIALFLVACRKAFRDELALLQKLRHPNVVQFLGAVTQSTPMMIVTEYLPKVSLRKTIKILTLCFNCGFSSKFFFCLLELTKMMKNIGVFYQRKFINRYFLSSDCLQCFAWITLCFRIL